MFNSSDNTLFLILNFIGTFIGMNYFYYGIKIQ